MPVSGDKNAMTLGDFKPSDDFVFSVVTFMTPGGATPRVDFDGGKVAARYVYWADEDDTEAGVAGWYLEDDEDATVCQNAVNIPFGTGFLVYRTGSEANATITYAGAVSTDPVTKGFPNAQYNVCGNSSPVAIKLGDITPSDDFVFSAITFMTPGGATPRVEFDSSMVAQRYVYWADADDTEAGAIGWYLEDDEDATVCQNNVEIAAGQGFLVYRTGSEAAATITIPSAL